MHFRERALRQTWRKHRFAICFIMLMFCTTPVWAGITFYNTFKNARYTQNSNAQPVSPSNYFADATIISNNPPDLTSAQVTSSAPLSPLTLNNTGSGRFSTALNYASQAAMDAAFPGTTYQYNISGGILGSTSASLTTPATDLFASQVPFLSGTTFTQLQGLNSANAFTVTWPGFTPQAGINDAIIFFSITRVSDGATAFSSGALGNSQTSVLLPANTLLPNTAYQFELDYSSRIRTTNAGFGNATSSVGFDLRTGGNFATAPVPEPSGMIFLAASVIAFPAARRPRR